MKVLITGGAGFIGSTIASCCADRGIEPIVLDDLSTGRAEFAEGHALHLGDLADRALIDRIFAEHPDIDATIHCAAHIVVPESVDEPLRYYRNNVGKTIALVEALLAHGCTRFVMSSSASMYRPGPDLSVTEASPLEPTSPYARTKMMNDLMLADLCRAGPLRAVSLRYFNPVGADPQLRTGHQDPAPSHVLARLIAARTSGEPFVITGTDWPTRDGSTIRDYIHVWDLAEAHVAALDRFDQIVDDDQPFLPINLGTGAGTTVRELLAAFVAVTGVDLEVVEAGRRPGDAVGCFTRSEVASQLLGWTAQRSLEDAIADAIAWADKRPSVLGD